MRLQISSHNNNSMGWSHYIQVFGHPTIADGTTFASVLTGEEKNAGQVISYINSVLYQNEERVSETLAEALPREMARVRDEVLPEYLKIPAGAFAALMMRQSLDAAARAMAAGDLAGMIAAYNDLKEYTL